MYVVPYWGNAGAIGHYSYIETVAYSLSSLYKSRVWNCWRHRPRRLNTLDWCKEDGYAGQFWKGIKLLLLMVCLYSQWKPKAPFGSNSPMSTPSNSVYQSLIPQNSFQHLKINEPHRCRRDGTSILSGPKMALVSKLRHRCHCVQHFDVKVKAPVP